MLYAGCAVRCMLYAVRCMLYAVCCVTLSRARLLAAAKAADGVGHHNGSGDLHLHNQPTTLLDLASTCTLNPNDDMPPPVDPNALSYSIVNGVRVRRRKKRVPVTTQLRMSVSKDEKTQRISLSFDLGNQTARNNAAEDCNGGNTAARNNAAENCNVENTTARNNSADDSVCVCGLLNTFFL